MSGWRHDVFEDRRDAGRAVAERLAHLQGHEDLLVLALPRGGVAVGFEVARALHAPLDVFVVRKLGVPGHEELAMGAIASGGIQVLHQQTIRDLGVTAAEVERAVKSEERELERRERAYRDGRPAPVLRGRTVILVDDGLATGASMSAAVSAVRQQEPSSVVVAVPVAASTTCAAMRRMADVCVCAETPEPFYGVGQWYADFSQTTDDEVRALLTSASPQHTTA